MGQDDVKNPAHNIQNLVFIVFFFSTMLNMVIMLNLLISILSETYANAREKQMANRTYELVQIISGIDIGLKSKIINGSIAENQNYLFLVKPIDMENENVYIFHFLLI